MKRYCFILLTFLNFSVYSQTPKLDDLREQTGKFNKVYQYESSIQLISEFIDDPEVTPYERARAYIMKSYIYKRLFDYDETLKCLDKALAEGEKSSRAEEIRMQVTAEKSFAFFDTQQYEKAKTYMNDLKSADYAYLQSADVAFVIMQEGQLYMFEKDFQKAEKSFDEAIVLLKKFDPGNLPVVYGKKVELYNKMGLPEKRDEAFQLGIASAKENRALKYRIYMHEVMAGQYEYNRNYKGAFFQNKTADSLSKIYDANEHNMKLKLYEKQLQAQKKEYELATNRKTTAFLIVLSVALLILTVISLKLYISTKQKRQLLEKDYERMYDELQLLTRKMKEDEKTGKNLSRFNLSERHMEIIDLIGKGKTNKEIANALFISENTVKYHLKIIYDTLKIDNRNKLFQLLHQ